MDCRRPFISALAIAISCSLLSGCNSQKNGHQTKQATKSQFFTEITDQVRLNFFHDAGVDGSYFMPESIGSGGGFLDYDNDGDLDIYLLNGARHDNQNIKDNHFKNRLFRQEADGTFTDVTDTAGLGGRGYAMGLAAGDIDNDGDIDIYVSNYGPDTLYRNNGDGTFTDITEEAGIHNSNWSSSVMFFDYDQDGFLDIYVANYLAYDSTVKCTDRGGRLDYCGPEGFSGVSNVLYRNDGGKRFVDVSIPSGIASIASKSLGVVTADLNGDHFPDIYVANDGEPNELWINKGDGTFENRALALGAAVNSLGRTEAGMGIAFGDIDNDGRTDLFVTHLRGESNILYRSKAAYGFQDDTSASGLDAPSFPLTGWGTGFFDYDNDGDLDLAVVNGRVTRGPLLIRTQSPTYWDYYAEPRLLFKNDGSGKFRDVSNLASDFCGSIENSRALAFGDIDNDGDVDLLVTNDGGKARLYRNDVDHKGNWLLIRAIDPSLKREAYGARITIELGEKRIVRMLSPGYSYLSSNDPRVHFGLGAANRVDAIQVEWPDGKTERFSEVAANQKITLTRGQVK
jgi:hypothetical protein